MESELQAELREIGSTLDHWPAIVKAARKYANLPEQVRLVAGLLSTIDFQPSQHHPVQMEPIARQVINLLVGITEAPDGQ